MRFDYEKRRLPRTTPAAKTLTNCSSIRCIYTLDLPLTFAAITFVSRGCLADDRPIRLETVRESRVTGGCFKLHVSLALIYPTSFQSYNCPGIVKTTLPQFFEFL